MVIVLSIFDDLGNFLSVMADAHTCSRLFQWEYQVAFLMCLRITKAEIGGSII